MLFDAGAGGIGHYQHCAWQVLGLGQFQATTGATPFVGSVGELEKVAEWRVETLVAEINMMAVVTALKMTHPYEVPAFEFIQLFHVDAE